MKTRFLLLLAASLFGACGPDNNEGVCGDGAVDAGEECDDGNTANGDGCESDCKLPVQNGFCGDGTVDANEACDDDNTTPADGCNGACAIEAGFGCAGSPSLCGQVGPDCGPPANLAPFAQLQFCDLSGADLSGANLANAFLIGADLSNANLT